MLFALSVLCPPLATLAAGSPRQALLTAALTLFLFVPGVVHAWAVVSRFETDRRNETLLRIDALQYA